MIPSRRRTAWLAVPVYLAMFLGGALVGTCLAQALAPSSAVAELAGFLALPGAFALGYVGWLGRALLSLPRVIIGRINQSRPSALRGSRTERPPGSFAFVPASVVVSIFAGSVVGLASGRSLVVAVAIYAVVGAAYGLACWRLARAGFLQFPRD